MAAALPGVGAARCEAAAARRVDEIRRSAGDGEQPGVAWILELGDAAHQRLRVRHPHVGEQGARRRVFDDPPGVHHGDPVGAPGDDAEVVGDEDDRRAEVARDPAEQLEDLDVLLGLLDLEQTEDELTSATVGSIGEYRAAVAIAADYESRMWPASIGALLYAVLGDIQTSEGTPAVKAVLTTALTGVNNDLTFLAKTAGAAGNDITVALVDPSGNDQDLAVTVSDNAISVSLATGEDGAITSTAREVRDAVNADSEAAALVAASLAPGNDGSGVVTALAAANLAEAYAPESIPILALEEPEAHLHPSAIRSLGSFLETMTGQILVSSHSGDLISGVPLMALRRLYKQNGDTKIGQVKSGIFTDRELQAIDYSIRLARGHYLFSRCWLLVEGESDFHLMLLLFELMGHLQDQVSFSVLEISQIIDKGEPLIKLAKALGIQWFLMVDGDHAGNDYLNRANNHLATDESLSDRALALTHADIEHEFWHNGYDGFIQNMVSNTRKSQIEAEAADDEVNKRKLLIKAAIKQSGGKPSFAQALVNEIRQRGGVDSIPQTIRDIITRVVQLAGG